MTCRTSHSRRTLVKARRSLSARARGLRFEKLEDRALLATFQINLSPNGGALNLGANAYTRDHAVEFSASNESGQPASAATGGEIGTGITYDDVTNELTFSFAYGSDSGFTNLGSNFAAAHIHGPGIVQFPAVNADGAILIDLASFHEAGSSTLTGTFAGTVTLSAAQEVMLFDNSLYINIHSSTFASGEIRAQLIPLSSDRIGVKRDNQFFQDVNGNGNWDGASDRVDTFGNSTDTAVVGDWDGDGFDEIGVYRGNQFLLDANGNGVWNPGSGDLLRTFGNTGDIPVIGDWDGDGTDDIGVRRGNSFLLDASGDGAWGAGDQFFTFGNAGDTPLSGDWDGDGSSEIGVHRLNRFFLDVNGNGSWGIGDVVRNFGNTTDLPLVGDWNADATDEIGVKRSNLFYLDANASGTWDGGMVDTVHNFGNASDLPLIGQWQPLSPLMAEGGAALVSSASGSLTSDALAAAAAQAIVLWANTGLTVAQIQLLNNVSFSIADLEGAQLGVHSGGSITLDEDAAGYGWFVDVDVNAEVADDSMDLLTAVLHELGHELGFDHDTDIEAMVGTLAVGTRRLL